MMGTVLSQFARETDDSSCYTSVVQVFASESFPRFSLQRAKGINQNLGALDWLVREMLVTLVNKANMYEGVP